MALKIMGRALVLKQFEIDSQNGRVIISGRKSGILSWLLCRLGIDAVTTLEATPKEMVFRSGSLFGEITTSCPVRKLSSVQCGYAKPIHSSSSRLFR
jgi:hypothetical protein